MAKKVFTWRQEIFFPDVSPTEWYNLPFFLHDAVGSPVFTDESGQALIFCEDTAYTAHDHRLIWLEYPGSEKPSDPHNIVAYMHLAPEHGNGSVASHASTVDFATALECSPSQTSPPEVGKREAEDIFAFADFFRGTWAAWQQHAGPRTAVKLVGLPLDDGPGLRCASDGRGLRFRGSGRVVLSRAPRLSLPNPDGRLHLRARFYDSMEGAVTWLGLASCFGTAAVGAGSSGCYTFLHGHCGSEDLPMSWHDSKVIRKRGWHLFELECEDQTLHIRIDGETVSRARAQGAHTEAKVWLAAEGNSCGTWHGIELIRTPHGRGTWEVGVQKMGPAHRRPWRVRTQQEGRWQFDDTGTIQQLPEEENDKDESAADAPLDEQRWKGDTESEKSTEHVEDEVEWQQLPGMGGLPQEDEQSPADQHDSDTEEVKEHYPDNAEDDSTPPPPPIPARRTRVCRSRPTSRASSRTKTMDSSVPTLHVECWSLPVPETTLARMDRMMETFIERLRAAGVALPDNIRRIGTCEDQSHSSCFIYSFGTRRLHVSAREADAGRLLLVVRCGGGFVDFAEFAMRHGSLEQLKLHRQDAQGRQVVRLSSVLSSREFRVREM
eukprot:gnl/TRDRNA2_/TRDRNA2_179787_c0_seq1.p1 gnl/TRDRNA2_/TRDRNA2_179787_c0~~gnl/TRDRNA2_/TRDRNA2_179787_c0_seq1.p1  ORF type:complete len:606 (+),score=81.35 gnl/TRDRNA2_/TRDRNA2_179787_c0_seq1:71-1888(+)